MCSIGGLTPYPLVNNVLTSQIAEVGCGQVIMVEACVGHSQLVKWTSGLALFQLEVMLKHRRKTD